MSQSTMVHEEQSDPQRHRNPSSPRLDNNTIPKLSCKTQNIRWRTILQSGNQNEKLVPKTTFNARSSYTRPKRRRRSTIIYRHKY